MSWRDVISEFSSNESWKFWYEIYMAVLLAFVTFLLGIAWFHPHLLCISLFLGFIFAAFPIAFFKIYRFQKYVNIRMFFRRSSGYNLGSFPTIIGWYPMVLFLEAENGSDLDEYEMKSVCPATVKARLSERLRMVTERVRPEHRLTINCQNTRFLNMVLSVRHSGSIDTSSDFALKVYVRYNDKWMLRSSKTVRITPPEDNIDEEL